MQIVPLYSVIPFVLLLCCIAVLPISHGKLWEKNLNKFILTISLSIPALYWLILNGYSHELIHTVIFDYLPFIILMGSLYIITGGIYISGDIEAKPVINTSFLAIGAVLSSLIGTTGAVMLLIRPILNTNSERNIKAHTIVFLIAIVANSGGLLSPIGNPPIFMMYLRGTPFFWFLKLFPVWLFANGLLLIIYFFIDKYYLKSETKESLKSEETMVEKIKIHGGFNFLWLTCVIAVVILINPATLPFIKEINYYFIREIIMILMAVMSLIFTKKHIRESNNYKWEPIEEIAYLFLGIFITMIPCILYLQSNAGKFGITSPIFYYYSTGFLSSILDNAPTAITMHSLVKGLMEQSPELFANQPIIAGIPEIILKSISTAAVFFGGMTYIGNGPNFMIKAIAESDGINMPHFFEYIYKFSLIILLPVYILVQLIFF